MEENKHIKCNSSDSVPADYGAIDLSLKETGKTHQSVTRNIEGSLSRNIAGFSLGLLSSLLVAIGSSCTQVSFTSSCSLCAWACAAPIPEKLKAYFMSNKTLRMCIYHWNFRLCKELCQTWNLRQFEGLLCFSVFRLTSLSRAQSLMYRSTSENGFSVSALPTSVIPYSCFLQ